MTSVSGDWHPEIWRYLFMTFVITDKNYISYKQVLAVVWKHQLSLMKFDFPIDSQPIQVLERMEKESMSLAKKGLKSAIIDISSIINDFPEQLKAAIDYDLEKAGLPNLKTLRASIGSIVNKAIKRGRIRNEEEYYAINELLGDLTSGYSQNERTEFERLVLNFEVDAGKRKRR
jgi:hypothetical protein